MNDKTKGLPFDANHPYIDLKRQSMSEAEGILAASRMLAEQMAANGMNISNVAIPDVSDMGAPPIMELIRNEASICSIRHDDFQIMNLLATDLIAALGIRQAVTYMDMNLYFSQDDDPVDSLLQVIVQPDGQQITYMTYEEDGDEISFSEPDLLERDYWTGDIGYAVYVPHCAMAFPSDQFYPSGNFAPGVLYERAMKDASAILQAMSRGCDVYQGQSEGERLRLITAGLIISRDDENIPGVFTPWDDGPTEEQAEMINNAIAEIHEATTNYLTGE